MKIEKFILAVVALLAAFGMGFFSAECCRIDTGGGGGPSVIVKRDTMVVVKRDTVRVSEPRLVREVVLDTVADTERRDNIVKTELLDTVRKVVIDTVRVYARVQREFAGENYRAWVSGVYIPPDAGPWLDSVHVYNDVLETTITIKERQKPKRWGLGVQIGTTWDFARQRPQPYVGVGVSYNLLSL